MKKRNAGFTLIELLVVIAIIGILSSVVLSSLSTARTRANDTKVKSQLVNVRNAAEEYFGAHYNYGTATNNSCTGGMFTDTTSNLPQLVVSTNYPTGATLVCNSSASAYAVSANLAATSTYWCVDSNGSSKQESSALGTATVCP